MQAVVAGNRFSWQGLTGSLSGSRWPFQLDYPKADDLTTEMQDYIVSTFGEFEEKLNDPSATPRGCRYCHPSWTDYIDIDSFVDYMIVQEISKNVDGYRLSTYFHKQADSDGGLFVMGPIWDVNLGFDNADYVSLLTPFLVQACAFAWQALSFAVQGGGHDPTGWVMDMGSRRGRGCSAGCYPFWWRRFLEEEAFTQRLRCRWDALRRAQLSDAALTARIADHQAVLMEAQARNFETWHILGTYVWPNPSVEDTWQEEVDRMRDWILTRARWLDRSIPPAAAAC